ncbi:hypothetical protein [Streptomyces roseolilacinus]|uniref:Integral membrane protein n=1 Tax=Streptomyces roseolilacinus TaxID=66904 RepID=A0A918AYQ4_9ACTN|nr:hypothetical protein [Streptomyces roseolilacinus]GGQ03460.1 hypothetical protein GCM10010249_22210 [Streptomyces roseolilacinus]
MYGPGPVPPQRRTPTHVVVLRVLFAVLPLLSLGFLTGAATLRLAVVTRRPRDWGLFGVSVIVTLLCMIFIPEDTDSMQANLSVGGILLNAALFTGYFLYADIRHHDTRAARPAGSPYATTFPLGSGYGYPAPQPRTHPGIPPAAMPQYGQPQPQVQVPPQVQVQVPAPPQPQPQPQPRPSVPPQAGAPAAPRIDQVRAELDELSDLLRREDGGR